MVEYAASKFKRVLVEHEEVFAMIKRLAMSSNELVRQELAPRARVEVLSRELGAMAELCLALREIVTSQDAADASDLIDAIGALDAINPGSPEWGPAFLQLSELVEARATAERSDFSAEPSDARHLH